MKALEEPIHGSQREDIKQYLQRMERVIAQAEELHHHTIVQSNSTMRRSNFSRRRSYSGKESVPAGVKDTNPLRRSYCVATNGSREGAPESGHLQGRNQAANSSHANQEALLDSGATLSEWIDGEMGGQPSTQESAMGDQRLECAASQNSEDVLQDPEACLTFRIGSDGVPISDSDCDSVLIASPVRGGITQQYGTPPRKGPSTVASPLSRGYVTAATSPAPSLPQEEFSPERASDPQGVPAEMVTAQVSPHSYPVTISVNTFCASEQPSQSLAASMSSLTSMRRHAAPQMLLIEAHAAVSAQTEGITIADEELGDTGDSKESGASEGDKFLTPEDSTHGSASVASHAETAASQISSGASVPPNQHAVTQPGPLSADNTEQLLGADLSETSAVADVVRFLASASSRDASRRADSADTLTAHVAAGEESAGQQKLSQQGIGKQDAAANSLLDVDSGVSKTTVVPAHQTGDKAAEGGSMDVSDDAADVQGCVRVPQSDGVGVVSAGQAEDSEAASEEVGDRRRSALQKLKGRLRTRQQNAVSRSREKLLDASDTTALPIVRPSSAAVEGPQPWPSQHMRSPLKSLSRPSTPGDGEVPSRIPRPSSASPSQHGSPRIRAMIPSRLPRPPTPGTPGRPAPGSPLCEGLVQVACTRTPRSHARIPSISQQASASADALRDIRRPASPAAASGGAGRPGSRQPSGPMRPGSARLDFQLAEDGAVSFLGRQHGDAGSHRPASGAKLDGLTSGSSVDTYAATEGSRSSGCTSSGSALTVAQEGSSRNSGHSRAGSTTTGSSGASAVRVSAARPASPHSVSSKLGSNADAAAHRARGMAASGAAPARSSTSAVLARRAVTSCDNDKCAVLPARPSTSPPQASMSTSSSAVSSELRASRKHTSKSRPAYANVKPRTDSHLDLNYIPVAKGHHRSNSLTSQAPATKPAWGSQAAVANLLGSSRRNKTLTSKAGLIRDKQQGSASRETTLDAAEKLPYDALLGHVTNLLSEVRTALRQ